MTEDEVVANAEFMAEHLLRHGWDTIVVDIAWYDPTARAHGYNVGAPLELDAYGRQLPAVNRFPSAAGGLGFAPLAARVHALGLRFGLHVMRGIPRLAVEADLPIFGGEWTAREAADTESVCAWNPDNFGLDHTHPAAQAYYDAQVSQFAQWGVDFIKADDMLWPYHAREIESYASAIRASGRSMELSLSPGRDISLAHLPHLRANSSMWRVSDDLWDRWQDVEDQFGRMARWAPYQSPAGWADADMLPIGRIGIRAERGEDRQSLLLLEEQRTLVTLWVISRSPLMMGGDLPTTARPTMALLTNDRVLDVLRTARGSREVLREKDLVLWTAEGEREDGRQIRFAAAFHLGAEPARIRVALGDIGGGPDDHVVDLWTHQAVDLEAGALAIEVPAHGARLFSLDG